MIVRCLPGRIIWFSGKLKEQEGNLFWYILFLRITPLLPNWFINISSPALEVPLFQFALATFFGLMPLNILHLRTGLMLSEATTVGGFDPYQFLWLMLLGCVALIPTMFTKKLEKVMTKDGQAGDKKDN